MKHDPRPAIHMEKLRHGLQFGWAHSLGGTESLGISRVGQIVLAMLMESQIWQLPVDSVAFWREGSEKSSGFCLPFCLEESWSPALTPMPDTAVPPCMLLVLIKLLPWC